MMDYTILSLDDFGNIPADRLETCLAELLPVLQGVSTARALGAEVSFQTPVTWKDDGKENLTIRVSLKAERKRKGE